jgi:serine/threonine protein kinase
VEHQSSELAAGSVGVFVMLTLPASPLNFCPGTGTRNVSTGGLWVCFCTRWYVYYRLRRNVKPRPGCSPQLTGLPPFYDENTNEMYRKILSDPLRFPDEVGSEARSLLTALLDRDPSRRLGVKGAQEIKNHPFFSRHIDFKKLWAKKIQPPFKPAVASAIDTSNFDEEFTSEVPLDSVVDDSHLSQTVQQQL